MIDPSQLREYVIRPTLMAIGHGAPAAEELLLGTAIQESGLKYLHQIGGGPAVGLWQMEPTTHDDCYATYLDYRGPLRASIVSLSVTQKAEEMAWNLRYACAMARIKYLRSPLPLPAAGDVEGMAAMWKQCYNSAGGAGSEEQYVKNWRRVMGV